MSSQFLQQLHREQGLQRPARSQFLYYLLRPGAGHLILTLVVARPQPNGRLGALQPYQLQPAHLKRPPLFLDASDVERLRQLADWDPHWLRCSERALPAAAGPQWLEALISSGRVRDDKGMSAIWSDPLALDGGWELDHAGNQRLGWRSPPGVDVLSTRPPCFWDSPQCRGGAVATALPAEALAWLEQRPQLLPEEVAEFVRQQGADFARWGLPLPRSIALTAVSPRPEPKLRFHHAVAARGRGSDCLQLQFLYPCGAEAAVFDAADTEPSQRLYTPGQNELFLVSRDVAAEAGIRSRLQEALAGFAPRTLAGGALGFASAAGWQAVMTEVVPALQRQGWRITVDGEFHHHFVKADDIHLSAVARDRDWFELALHVDIDGETLALLPLLAECARRYSLARLRALAADALLPLGLPDGRQLLLPAARLARWLAALVELEGGSLAETLRLPLSQLDRLNTLAADDLTPLEGADALLQRARQLRRPPGLDDFILPPDFSAELRGYQRLGVAWLQQRRVLGVGGILADDMGLGKTVQALAHLAIERHAGRLGHQGRPALVVAPTSVLDNWRRESGRFAPGLRCLLLHGPQRHQHWDALADYDLLLTSYALVTMDIEHWQRQPLSMVILDEAQAIKNARTRISQHVRQLQAPYRLCLTGTPLENHLGELWSQFEFLMPGFLDSENRFKRQYRKPIEEQGDQARAAALMDRVGPFILRRRKEEVARELPPKTEIVLRLPMQEAQRDLYEVLRQRSVAELAPAAGPDREGSEQQRDRMRILAALMQLRQVCCDPELLALPDYQGTPSVKRTHLLEMLRDLVEEGRAVLVFSQFTSMLKLLAADLTRLGMSYLMLTGQSRDRGALVEKFQRGHAAVFLVSLKAGGVGLNLTRADTVIHYDPWWNSAAENQATDRAHRIGQDKPVFVYKLLTENTVEEKIHALQQHKHNLLEQVYQVAEANTQQLARDNKTLLALLAEVDG